MRSPVICIAGSPVICPLDTALFLPFEILDASLDIMQLAMLVEEMSFQLVVCHQGYSALLSCPFTSFW